MLTINQSGNNSQATITLKEPSKRSQKKSNKELKKKLFEISSEVDNLNSSKWYFAPLLLKTASC